MLASGLIASLLLPAVQAQITDAVYSVNIIGMQKVTAVSTNDGGLVMIANPFIKSETYIDKIVGTSGVAGATLGAADNVQIFNPLSQQFDNYWLFSSANPAFNRRWRSSSGFATNVNLTPGMGFWYRNRSGQSMQVTMVGDVETDATVTNVVMPGLQILSYPYSAPCALTDLGLTNGVAGSSLGVADNIQIYDPATKQFNNYWLLSNANPLFNRKWRSTSGLATNVVVNPGQSFWYRSRSISNIVWVASRPYDL